jgi:hypothetical protein
MLALNKLLSVPTMLAQVKEIIFFLTKTTVGASHAALQPYHARSGTTATSKEK